MKRLITALSLVLLWSSINCYAGSKSFDFSVNYTMSENVKVIVLDNKDGGPIVFNTNRFDVSGNQGKIIFDCTDLNYSRSDFFYVALYYQKNSDGPHYLKIPLSFRSYTRTNNCYIYGSRNEEKIRCDSYWFF